MLVHVQIYADVIYVGKRFPASCNLLEYCDFPVYLFILVELGQVDEKFR